MWLVDSNILIRAASAPDHPLQEWLQNQLPAISVVTRIEVLGFHRLRPDEDILLRVLFASFDEYPIGTQTATLAIGLRRQRKMSLGDALMAGDDQIQMDFANRVGRVQLQYGRHTSRLRVEERYGATLTQYLLKSLMTNRLDLIGI